MMGQSLGESSDCILTLVRAQERLRAIGKLASSRAISALLSPTVRKAASTLRSCALSCRYFIAILLPEFLSIRELLPLPSPVLTVLHLVCEFAPPNKTLHTNRRSLWAVPSGVCGLPKAVPSSQN